MPRYYAIFMPCNLILVIFLSHAMKNILTNEKNINSCLLKVVIVLKKISGPGEFKIEEVISSKRAGNTIPRRDI